MSIYRKYIDRYMQYGSEGYYVEPEDRKMLLDLFDRGGFTSGYYERHNGRDMVALREKPEFREVNQKLFDYLDKTYVEKELKEAIEGHVVLAEAAPASLKLSRGDVQVCVTGQAPQAAQNQPMAEEKVLKQLNKTGNTPFFFESLTADIKGSLFLPIQALNELRRDGLAALQAAILRQWERGETLGPAAPEPAALAPATGFAAPAPKAPTLIASIETPSQLPSLLACREISVIYLDAAGFAPSGWQETVRRCHQAGKQCWLMLPHIFRTHAMTFFANAKSQLKGAGFDGLLVRALEEVQWLREEEISLPFGLDASVYTWNSSTVRLLERTGAAFLTMPWELNSREMEPVVKTCRQEGVPAHLIVYGHAPMMVSAQCITRTVKGCSHKKGLLYMKDRTGALLPVKNNCDFCYNTILNPLPLSLLGNEKIIEKMGADSLRLAFTVETEEKQEQVLAAFLAAFVRGERAGEPSKDFTRGHFKRGVE